MELFCSSSCQAEERQKRTWQSPTFPLPWGRGRTLKCAQSREDEEALNIVDCKIHMHIGSPAGQLLNLSVHQRKEQLWPCIGKTSRELLGSTECKAPLKTHPLLQTTTNTSPFPKVSSGSGKHASFGAWGKRAGDTALLCKYGMWHWSEELWEKWTEEQVSWGTGSSGGSDAVVIAVSVWPWQSSADQTSSHRSNPHLQKLLLWWEVESAKHWKNPTTRENVLVFLFNIPLSYKLSPLLLQRPHITHSFTDL